MAAPASAAVAARGDDEVDVLAAARGEAAAWARIHDRYARLIWHIVRSYHLDDGEAADVCQTVWLRLAENLGRLREPAQVKWWLATTARREAFRTQQRVRRVVPVDHDFDLVADSSQVSGEDAVDDRDEAGAVMKAFRTLPSACQVLLQVLIFEPTVTYAEVSERLELPIGTIGPRRARCIERLRRASECRGGRPAA